MTEGGKCSKIYYIEVKCFFEIEVLNMSKKLTVELAGSWVLQHRGDDKLPIPRLVELLSQKYTAGMKILQSTLTSMVIEIDDAVIDSAEMEKTLDALFRSAYPDENPLEVLTVCCESNAQDDKQDAPEPKQESGAGLESFLKRFSGGSASGEEQGTDAAPKVPQEPKQSVAQKIDNLIGADPFKEIMHELIAIAPQVKKSGSYDVLTYQSYLLSINEGYGLSTYLSLFSELLQEYYGDKFSSREPIEIHIPMPKNEQMDPFKQAYEILEREGSRTVKLLCIDISEWMNVTHNYQFKAFLSELGRHMSEFIVVFRIPFVDKEIVNSIRYSLNDLVYVRDVSIPPFTGEELQKYAQKELENYGFAMEERAWEGFHQRITEEKSDGRFYGLNTVKKILRELLYKKQLSNAKSGVETMKIVADDTNALCVRARAEGVSGYDMLENMIGGQAFREKIDEILSQIELARRNPAVKSPCIHMRFVGNPGTGKTTVARIIGKILKDRGVLRIGNFYEYAGRDFCGRYVGETAPKTASICRDAYGSVLFIDEAYSLYRSGASGVDYGREALDTLIAEMENHRTDLVVIMAGYTDEMETLMHGNAGLASRMPYVIEFPNFNREQLFSIYMSMARAAFATDDELEAQVKAYFDSLPDELLLSKEFSNARFVRNLFERTCAKATMRCQLTKQESIVLTADDFKRSIADKEFKFMMQKKSRLGFIE